MDQGISREGWTKVIAPHSKWYDFKLGELWEYRTLILMFFRRDFAARYKQTILGSSYYILLPIVNTVVFTIIFSGIASLPTDEVPPFLFYMSGTILWSYFSTVLTATATTFTANASLFGKVYFPRLTIPISIMLSNMVAFGVQFAIFLMFWGFFAVRGAAIHPNNFIFFIPILLLLMAGLGLGFGVIITGVSTRYRDLTFLVPIGTQLLMYASPVVYPLSLAPEKYRWILLANPMTVVIEAFRYGFFGSGHFEPIYLVYSGGVMLMVLMIGTLIFNRTERDFMDTV